MPSTFVVPQKIITGRGSVADCADEVSAVGKRCLLVTGRSAMRRAGAVTRLQKQFHAAGIEPTHYAGIAGEPTVHMVDEGRKLLQDAKSDVVVGLGGGSALDAAKAIAGLANVEGPTSDFHAGKEIEATGVPFVAVPTTSGTGAEVTMNAVISDPERSVKKSIRHSSFMARVAIVDPELTASAPPDITAASGMDALTQGIESFTSINATPLTESLSLGAIRLIAASLERACKDGKDMDAREHMSYGSLMAGMALANARLGVVHGLAHPLGVRYSIPHGVVCGVLLPHAMRLNEAAARDKYRRISEMIHTDAIEFVQVLLVRLSLPGDLSQYAIPKRDFDTIIEESMPSGSLKANPKKITEEDLRWILDEVT